MRTTDRAQIDEEEEEELSKETYFRLVRRGFRRLLLSPRFLLGKRGFHLRLDLLLLGVRRHESAHASVLRLGALIVRHILDPQCW